MNRLLVCVCAVWLPAASLAADEGVVFVASPFAAADQASQFLDAVDLRIMLPMGYAYSSATGVLDGRLGLVENRVYVREAEEGRRVLETAIISGMGGGVDFALLGRTESAPEEAPNADMAEVVRRFQELVEQSRAVSRDQVELGYEMFRLGHIEADRALGLLKALGYHTIEFEEKSSRSESSEKIFELVQEREARLPWIVKVVNASKTSLLQDDPGSKVRTTVARTKTTEGAPKLGGSHLHSATTGAPEERLLLVYNRYDPEGLEKLVNLLQAHVDLPAQQIVIEALIIEVNTNKLRDIGVELSGAQGSVRGSFESSAESNTQLGSFVFSRKGFTDFLSFKGSLEALTESGDAEILSSPSVLVLNDRQARIQVGRQIPVSKTTATTSAVTRGIEYFPVGIVLNLRPRINREQTEVTLQIETIISSISTESAQRLETTREDVAFSPIVDNRLVETYVRVADGTPFIIGGLLSTNRQETKIGVPFISGLPLVGRLFTRERLEHDQREVIVVITPHIVPLEEKSFSYLIPKDSKRFDRFDTRLFRNAYRVRDDDVWDLEFIVDSPVLQEIVRRVRQASRENVLLQRREPFSGLLAGQVPGEEVLVRRMLYEIVEKLGFHREVNLDQVFFFTPPEDAARGKSFSDDLTLQELLPFAREAADQAVILSYQAQPVPEPGESFSLPLAAVRDTVAEVDTVKDLLWDLNIYDDQARAQEWAIVLADEDDVERLRKVLILKLVLALNENMPLTLQAFRPGVQILFPTREDMRNRYHLIDREAAQLFYETKYPYQVTQRVLNATLSRVKEELGIKEEAGLPEVEKP